MKPRIYLLSLISLLNSCNQDSGTNLSLFSNNEPREAATSAQLVKWVGDAGNGLKKERKMADYTYIVLYKPLDYIISREIGDNKIDSASYKEKVNELRGLKYFDLRIKNDKENEEILKHDVTSYRDYDEKIKYCSFEMQNDIQLLADQDTVNCTLFHFERTFDMAPMVTFLMGFEEEKIKKDFKELTLIYHDNLFHNGILKFNFSREELNSAPSLIY